MKIGILGLIGSGKDTFATMLQKHLPDFTIDHYAAPLKDLTAKIYNYTLEELEDREFKEKPKQISRDKMIIEVYFCLNSTLGFTDDELDKASELFFEHFSSAKAISPREFMQVFGTDVVRAVKPNAWVQHLQSKEGNLIVPDVRFENELCDYNILIQRHEDNTRPVHPSEHFAWDLENVDGFHVHYDDMYQVLNYPEYTLEELEYAAKQHAHRIRKL